jgi:dihydroflavonol-4-reductase
MRVVVTGGTGYLGRWIVPALRGAGHEVGVLARDARRAQQALEGTGAEIIVGDPSRRDDVIGALRGADRLVHAAAIYSYERRDAERMADQNPRLARTVLGAALDAGIGGVVDISSAVVFRLGVSRVDESTPIAGPGDRGWDDPYLRSKALAEGVGREFEQDGLRRVTLHPAMVVGPGDSGPGTSGALVVSLLRGGTMARGRLGWVDVREVAKATVAALDAAAGSRYILSIGSRSLPEVATALDSVTGRHPRRYFAAGGPIRIMARLNDLAAGRLAPLPTAPSLEYLLEGPPIIDGSRAERELAIHYRPLEDTLADAIRWWVANGVVTPQLAGRLA